MRKYEDKLLITPAKSKVQTLRDKIRQLIQSALGLSQEALLRQLNPLLRGWANYYRNGAAKATFSKLDYYVWQQTLALDHPTPPHANPKPGRSANTSPRRGTRGLSASGYHPKKGKSRVLTLYRMASTTIERHIKVRGAANPYDPRYTQYFAQRRCFAWRIRGTRPHDPNGRGYSGVRGGYSDSRSCRRRVPTTERTGWSGLSRMKGNFHVRFLGGCGRAYTV